jgi:hypothetical protein
LKNIFAGSLVSFLLTLTSWAQVTVIRAGHLVDPDTGKVLTNQLIGH